MSVEELGDYGMTRMDDDEISAFLANRRTGVLGLPTGDAPYLIPISFGFDGEAELYFTYVLGADSRKEVLSDRAELARFLAYRADSQFTWQSVLLTGPIDRVPQQEEEAVREAMDNAWHPDLFETADTSRGIALYRLGIRERTGIKHTGLPPEFER